MRIPNVWCAIALAVAVLSPAVAVRADGGDGAQPVQSGCGVSGGTLTMLATDNQSDFAAFALFDGKGAQIAQQFIPIYNPDASAELMLTPLGFGSDVASVKCLADSSARRCADPKWPAADNGLGVSLTGLLIGSDWAVISIEGRELSEGTPVAAAIDGATAGFQLDGDAVRWSSFYDSQTEASQAFFNIKGGDHTLTIGSRDPATTALVPQDRLCFTT